MNVKRYRFSTKQFIQLFDGMRKSYVVQNPLPYDAEIIKVVDIPTAESFDVYFLSNQFPSTSEGQEYPVDGFIITTV